MKFLNVAKASMPALGFGTWQLQGNACSQSVQRAIEIGYRHIDTAQIYENESDVGRGIKSSTIAREKLFITTKVWLSELRHKDVISSTHASLSKLQMEYVDLLLIHWPNPDIDLGETLSAMQELQQQGKTRAIGVSNFPVALMREAVEKHEVAIACNQIEYHVLLSQKPVLDYARAHNIIITAYSPLARGTFTNHPLLTEIGKRYGKTANQVALRWLIEQNVAAIPKAASEKNAKANFEIFDFSLSEADMHSITALNKNNRLINPEFAPKWDAA